MKLRTINYSVGQGFVGAWRNRYMVMASIGVAFATLLMIGVFFLISINIFNFREQIKSNYNIQAYFNIDVEKSRIDEIENELEAKAGVKNVEFVSKEAGAEKWKQSDEEMAKVLETYEEIGENPLTDSLIITLNSSDIDVVENVLSTYSEIANVRDTGVNMEKFLTCLAYAQVAIFVLMVIFVFVSILSISNTIKLGLYARKHEISIMKYIGATDKFVKLPFVIEAIIIGFVATLLSYPLVLWLYKFSQQYFNAGILGLSENAVFSVINWSDMIYPLAVCYAISGVFISILGSSISIKKHLKV